MQVEIALDFARGMAYLHSRRQPIVHRDLKPANLMIAGNLHADTEQLYLDSGIIKVADFGEQAARQRGDEPCCPDPLRRVKPPTTAQLLVTGSPEACITACTVSPWYQQKGRGCMSSTLVVGHCTSAAHALEPAPTPGPCPVAALPLGLSKSLVPVERHGGLSLDINVTYKLTGETGSYRYMAPGGARDWGRRGSRWLLVYWPPKILLSVVIRCCFADPPPRLDATPMPICAECFRHEPYNLKVDVYRYVRHD